MFQNNTTKIDVLIVEDDASIRESIEYNLKASGLATAAAANGAAGLERALELRPAVVLLDIMLPEIDGFELCRKLRARDEHVAILMVTALNREPDKLKSFSHGADDYITKPFSMIELTARIRAHLRRAKTHEMTTSEPIAFGDATMDTANYELLVKGERIHLRPREYQLLAFLASHPDKLYSRPQLAEEVWGDRFISSSRTIDVHIRRIRNQLERRSDYSFIRTLHALGYKFEPRLK